MARTSNIDPQNIKDFVSKQHERIKTLEGKIVEIHRQATKSKSKFYETRSPGIAIEGFKRICYRVAEALGGDPYDER